MEPILIAVAVLLVAGLLALVGGRNARWASASGALGAVAGGALTLFAAVDVLLHGAGRAIRWPWDVPLGSFRLVLDPLSAVFALAIAVIGGLAAVYACGYLTPSGKAESSASMPRKNTGAAWFFFNLLLASMLLVVTAHNGLLFLVSWEVMSLASFFLVMFEGEKPGVREAGWTYLVTTHLGTALLLAMFALLSRKSGSLDFDALSAPGLTGVVFLLGLIGFGTKAGLMPLHVWLPEAHPAAPSYVSAVMSGVMIKTGIYGLLRMLTFLGPPPAWWGWTFLAMGVVSGVLGVLYALSQHDLKRLLAYHSVENIGIIAMALGVGLLGVHYDMPIMAVFGFTGGLLHVVNHAIFKSLLFLGAGSVLHATGTGEIDRLGGLLKRMPVTGATFLVGAAAISGLPPLNGFVSEFLIFLGALAGLVGVARTAPAWTLMSVLVVGGLALIGGLAAACFSKAFGIVFLGEPRSGAASSAHEAGAMMRWPMMILAGLCVLIGLSAPLWPWVLSAAVAVIVPENLRAATAAAAGQASRPLVLVVLASYILLGLIVLLACVRRKLLGGRRVETAVTWDCGYAAPSPRMQYTASSFARPLTLLFRLFLQPRDEIDAPRGLFPQRASLHSHTPDLFRRYVYEPLFAGIGSVASKLRWLQEGRIQIYVLYIALTILTLLIWKLG
jgi:formate hydrogenlyase subunit 3/multisubunit Na+/H+ antiporter MnhD subunit